MVPGKEGNRWTDRGREDARARTTEKDEMEEESEGGAYIEGKRMRERDRETEKERERGREERDGIEKCGLGRSFSGLSPRSTSCHHLRPLRLFPFRAPYSNYVNTTQGFECVPTRGKRVGDCREVDGRNITAAYRSLYLGFGKVRCCFGIRVNTVKKRKSLVDILDSYPLISRFYAKCETAYRHGHLSV